MYKNYREIFWCRFLTNEREAAKALYVCRAPASQMQLCTCTSVQKHKVSLVKRDEFLTFSLSKNTCANL